MVKIFRRVRQQALVDSRLKKYLLYALGEITLVVIGILIALSVNNWNAGLKQQERLEKVYSRILTDTKGNILEIDGILEHYKELEPLFKDVMNDSLTEELIEADYGSALVTYYLAVRLEKTGYENLKALDSEDSLATYILDVYGTGITQLDLIESAIADNSLSTLKDWMADHAWFSELVADELNQEAIDYFSHSPDFKNKVAFHYLTVYGNYVRYLETLKGQLKEIQTDIESRKGIVKDEN